MGPGQVFDIEDAAWTPVREDLTEGIAGIRLVPDHESGMTVTVTKVQVGGNFSAHRDPYHHVLYFLQGRGEVSIEGVSHSVAAGSVVKITAGETHSYRNIGDEEMMLVTINVP